MKKKDNLSGDAAELRARAEETARKRLAQSPNGLETFSYEETLQMLYELRVHQIELEMQNEELRRAQAELDKTRARYFDLYDLAPVGYCTLSEQNLILEANLTASTLLGVARGALKQQPISRFILKEDQDIYYQYRRRLVDTNKPQTCELRMMNQDGMSFWVHLAATTAQGDDGLPVSRVIISDITERRKAEEALDRVNTEAEKERFRMEAVMEVLPTGVAIVDADGTTVRTNREYERIWAGPRPPTRSIEDFAVFKGWWADTGKPLAPEEWASPRAMHEGKSVVGQLLEIQRFDGSRAFVINSASPVKDADGNIIGSAVTIHDITDLRKTQEALRESDRLYRAIGEAIDYGVWICDVNGRNIYASESFLKLIGLTQEQCSDFGWGNALHPDDVVQTMAAWKECVQTGNNWDIEHRFRGVDEEWHHVLARGVPVKDEQGKITCWAGINLDINQLKHAEEVLQKNEERLRLALKAGKMATWDWHIPTGEVIWNDEHYRRLGYEVGAVKPSYDALTNWVHVDDIETTEAAFRAIMKEGFEYSTEFRSCWPDGSVHWQWALGEFDRDANGQAVRSYGVLLDITEEKETELRIQELNDALQEHVITLDAMNKELESYSHSVSHDLRTPLRFVNRIAHLLLHEPGAHLSNEATQQVHMILQATSEMAKLIEDLLVFSQASREPIRKRHMDLQRLFQEVAKELQHVQEGRAVEIVIQDLAPCLGDRTLLKEVVANLLENAFKFTRRCEKAQITIGCTETDDEVVYFVQDNGVGFDMSDSNSLFVPFHRLHKPADFEGTGIGLALVKRVVERHGGRIWALGEIDKGATFYFTLGKEAGQ